MKTFRRDALARLCRAGRLVSSEIYHFDDAFGQSREAVELPARMMAASGNSDWKDGYCNMRETDFKSSSGCAYESGPNLVTLIIHSNSNVTFRILAKGEAAPQPIRQDDARRLK